MEGGELHAVWRRWRSGIVCTALVHGGALLALSVSFYQPQPLAAPPSFAVEMLPEPPAAQPHPVPPQPSRMTPVTPVIPIAPPPASSGFALPPPAPPNVPAAVPKPVTTAPATPPAPPPAAAAAIASAIRPATSSVDPKAKVSWQSDVLARLEAAKRYPPSTKFAHDEATIQVQFEVDRSGRVLRSRLVRASGISDLDAESLALLKRVHLPPPPAGVPDEALSMTVPIEFQIDPS